MTRYPNAQTLISAYIEANQNMDFIGHSEKMLAWMGIKIHYNSLKQNDNRLYQLTIGEREHVLELFARNLFYQNTQNVAIAHAIGHYCLHSDDQIIFVGDRNAIDRTASFWNSRETAAIRFAEQLLMPAQRLALSIHEINAKAPELTSQEIAVELTKEYRVPVKFAEQRYSDFVQLSGIIESIERARQQIQTG